MADDKRKPLDEQTQQKERPISAPRQGDDRRIQGPQKQRPIAPQLPPEKGR